MYDRYTVEVRAAAVKTYRAERDLAEWSMRAADKLGRRSCPAMVIWGRKDPFLPVRYAEIQLRAFRDADVHVLNQSGHWPHLEAASQVEALAANFWAGVSAPSGSQRHQD